MRLHLVRHGPTHAGAMVGWTDLPADLSDAAALARLSRHLPPDAAIVSSDLSRAIATADAIQADRPRLPHHAGLREMHFGSWEMRRHADIEAEDPDRARAFRNRPGAVRPPGGESWNDLRARVDAALDGLIAGRSGPDLIVVAHFGTILTQLQRALGIDGAQVFAHRIDNLSVTEIRRDSAGWEVVAINRLP